MTYLQLVNAVMRRLREGEVASVSETGYSKLIGDFINEVKREVEDAHNWVQLRTTVQVDATVSTFRYTLTGAGDRSRLLQALNDTQEVEMKLAPYTWLNKQLNSNTNTTGAPIYFDINGNTSGDPNVDIWPIPDGSYTLYFNMVTPQDDLSADSDTLTIPTMPVILGAYARAVSERGEDGGTQYAEAYNQYIKAMGDAIAIDAVTIPDEMTWSVE